MIATITNQVSQGLQNMYSGAKMNWYGSNFNMPVPGVTLLYNYTTDWIRYQGPYTFINAGTSYSLSGYPPGVEICVGTTMWDFENDDVVNYNINTQLYQRWTDPSLNTIYWNYNGYQYTGTLPPGYYQPIWTAATTGCAEWEVSSAGTYHLRASCTGSPTVGTVDTPVTMSNIPSTTQLGSTKPGYIWVEGNNLAYINANQWKHSIVGTDQGNVGGTPGYFWCESLYGLAWIGGNGHKYLLPWAIKQFASTFNNSSTGATYAGTSNGGKIWVDNEFGWTHIAFINPNDGYKYLTGAGNYPYY